MVEVKNELHTPMTLSIFTQPVIREVLFILFLQPNTTNNTTQWLIPYMNVMEYNGVEVQITKYLSEWWHHPAQV